MSRDVWVTTEPGKSGRTCMCWRDAICEHGWTWQPENDSCDHSDAYEPVHESFADAVRSLWSVSGRSGIGPLVRKRYGGEFRPHGTSDVYVMPPGAVLVDDHEVSEESGPSPLWIISRQTLVPRRQNRAFDDTYRDV